MTFRHLTVQIPGTGTAALILAQPLTLDGLNRFEESLAQSLAGLRRELDGCAVDPGKLEYESWMK